jgi:hemolysin activation/secretion protein
MIDNKNAFLNVSALWKGFYSPVRKITLAGRLAAEKLYGDFPYYRAAYIGGGHSLRGYKSHRFAGDQAVSGTAEIRLNVTRRRVIFPSDIGLYLYSDGGKVWYEQESPGDWHITGGAGLYIAPLMRDFTIRASLARADEGTRFYWDLGFAF